MLLRVVFCLFCDVSVRCCFVVCIIRVLFVVCLCCVLVVMFLLGDVCGCFCAVVEFVVSCFFGYLIVCVISVCV